jgi:aminopeptidase N
MRRFAVLTLFGLFHLPSPAQSDTYPRQTGIDALHYTFRLTLGDDSNEIRGETAVVLRLAAEGLEEVFLDLSSAANGKGMSVSTVTSNGRPVPFTHQDDRLGIVVSPPLPAGRDASFVVQYRGVPADGLRFIDNIHGERTAFSQNFPNRARQWLPMIDHPYDKATGEFIVTAPARYQVVANDVLIEEVDLPDGWRRTHYRQSVPIASWLYAVGMARFAVHHAGTVNGVPLQSWVFPQDQVTGNRLFEATTRQAMEFFSERIGPYPYEKIANVQAAGIGGDTEHATIIFYTEKGVASGSGAVVHEIAHQWWGNGSLAAPVTAARENASARFGGKPASIAAARSAEVNSNTKPGPLPPTAVTASMSASGTS